MVCHLINSCFDKNKLVTVSSMKCGEKQKTNCEDDTKHCSTAMARIGIEFHRSLPNLSLSNLTKFHSIVLAFKKIYMLPVHLLYKPCLVVTVFKILI